MKINTITHARYKNAFNCKKCPQTSDENGCPVWWESVWQDHATGEQVLNKGCGFSMSQIILVGVASEARKPAAEISAMRGEVAQGIQKATIAMVELQRKQLQQNTIGTLERDTENEND